MNLNWFHIKKMYKPLKIQSFLRQGGTLNELREDPYNLKINSDPDKRRILFKYNQIESDHTLDIVREARGLILDRENNWNVVSFPFHKFYNYGEQYADQIDWDTARIWDKMDGTCAPLYYYDGEWVMHTLGTVEGEGPVHVDDLLSTPFNKTFSDLFFYAWDECFGEEKFNELDKNLIYVFELMTPYNIVVKEHKKPKITLLAVRNRESLDELDILDFQNEFPTPDLYDFSDPDIETLVDSLSQFPPDEEGYVVCDGNYNRIKLKNPRYVMRHKMKDKAINRANGILEIVLNEEADDFISTFPDLVDEINKIISQVGELINYLKETYSELGGPETDPDDSEQRKQFALRIKDQIDPAFHGYLFQRLSNDESFEQIIKSYRVDKVANSLKKLGD